ncbi:unnamed protein product, partial [Staurois parvus]
EGRRELAGHGSLLQQRLVIPGQRAAESGFHEGYLGSLQQSHFYFFFTFCLLLSCVWLKMKNEISAAVFFLSKLLKNNRNLSKEDIETFCDELSRILYDKYVNHWYQETPTKGQAYRCIRVNRYQGVDPDLQKACFNSGLIYEDLGLPKEMTLWVDPYEVCCRYGEKNPSFVVASFDSKDDEKMEISQKVNYAMEKVTSDYHSGSSSEDEVYISHKTPPTPVIPRTCDIYQVFNWIGVCVFFFVFFFFFYCLVEGGW